MKKKNIKSMFQYINLPIHPRTNSGKPQLHTERIIFSHIDYLSKCRDYHISISKALEKKRMINDLFINSIERYLIIYNEYIKPMNSERKCVADELYKKIKEVQVSKAEFGMFQSVGSKY